MKSCIALCVVFLCCLSCVCAQTGQFTSFIFVEAQDDFIVFEYEWWELDPVVNSKIVLDSQDYCQALHTVTTGSDICIVGGLQSGWYQYYLHVEDGDQLVDSTSMGSVFVFGRTLSVYEIQEYIHTGEVVLCDMLGRIVSLDCIILRQVYVVRWKDGRIEKVYFN